MEGTKLRWWQRGMLLVPLAALGAAQPVSGPGAELLRGVDLTIAGKVGGPSDKGPPQIQTVVVEADASIDQLLRRYGVVPDGDALTVTYLLNPEVQSLGALPAGTRLVLPAHPAFASLSVPDVPAWHLQVEHQTKAELREVQRSIEASIQRVSKVPAERFTKPEERAGTVAVLSNVRQYLNDLNETAKDNQLPLRPNLLRESLAEARIVQSAVESALASPGPWPASLQGQITEITDDLALKARSFDEVRHGQGVPGRWRGALVVVRLFAPDRRPVDTLRVYYAPRALADRPQFIAPFGRIAAEVSEWLGEANYLIWAGRDGDPAPITKRLRVSVRQGQDSKPLEVDLLVER